MMDLMTSHGSVGATGFVLLSLSVLSLFVGGLLLLFLVKTRGPLVVFAVASIIPFVIGLSVTLLLEHLGSVNSPPPLEHLPANWDEQIKHYAYIGTGATLCFWIMSVLGIVVKRGRNGAGQHENDRRNT